MFQYNSINQTSMDLSFGNDISSSLKLILQLFLLGLFLHIFGLPALDRYLDKKVMVVKSMEKADGIPIPAITIVVDGAADEFGWKTKIGIGKKLAEKQCQQANTTEILVGCIEKQTYNLSEISSGIKMRRSREEDIYDDPVKDQNWIEDYTHTYFGRIHTLDHSIQLKAWSHLNRNSMRLDLKSVGPNHSYDLYFHDPKYFYFNVNPEPGFPLVHKKVDPVQITYRFAIGLTEVVELAVPEDPCNADRDYNFKDCMKEYIASRVGCRTKGRVKTNTKFKTSAI